MSVKDVQPGSPRPKVILEDGRTLWADIVIGADGPSSVVRKTVLDGDEDAEPSGYTAFGGTIPAEMIASDPELSKLLQSNEVRCLPPRSSERRSDLFLPVARMDGGQSLRLWYVNFRPV